MLIIFEKFLFVFLLLSLLGVIAMQAPQWYTTLLPGIQRVEISGRFIHIDRLDIERAVQDAIVGDFFETDLALLEQQLENIQWIKRVWIKQVWPHTLRIEIEERNTVAMWGEDALIDHDGNIFTVDEQYKGAYPILYGGQGREKFLLDTYFWMSQALQEVDLNIYLLEESRRKTLRLVLSNGWHLQFGRKAWQERLDRFIQVYHKVLLQNQSIQKTVQCLDFRYAHGFATSHNHDECFT